MPNLVNDAGGIRYLDGLRSPLARKEYDTEAKKIAIELPDVPLLTIEDNTCKWDLCFICKDGHVFAHRLVISNVSKYIMHMLDDQPPWHTTYIHVLDMPTLIVQHLVDLAYTGEMRLTGDIQSDVIDAMHTLGWVHTDCLSLDYDVAVESPKKEDKGVAVVVKSGDEKKIETAVKMTKSPQRPKSSFVDDEESMEISHLPTVDLSEDEKAQISASKKAPEKRETKRGRISAKTTKSRSTKKDENVVPKKKQAKEQEKKLATRKSCRRASFSETNESVDDAADIEEAGSSTNAVENFPSTNESNTMQKPTKGKIGGNLKQPANMKTENVPKIKVKSEPVEKSKTADILALDETSQTSNMSESSSILDSPRRRQIRKPKRYEEYEESDKPKPRASPVKPTVAEVVKLATKGKKSVETSGSTVKVPPSTTQEEDKTTSSKSKDIETKNSRNSNKTKAVPKRKLSNETPLITSFFTKKTSVKTTDDGNNDDIDTADQDMPDLSQDSSVEIIESTNTTASSTTLDTNDNKLPILQDNFLDKQGTGSTDDTDDDEILMIEQAMMDDKRDSKKRSFDEIRSSHIEESVLSTAVSVEEKSELSVDALQENGEASSLVSLVVQNPARKSSRVASKAQSEDNNDEKNGGEDDRVPARKRSRQESTEVQPVVTPSRRSSKQ